MRRLAVIACLLAGCYSPRIDRCKITCTEACPAAQACLDDGFCHAAGDTVLCDQDAIDASVLDAEPEPDAMPASRIGVISAGGHHACAIDDGGRLWCWGSNRAGELGIGAATPLRRPTPAQIGTSTAWTAVDAGDNHVCGIDDGHLYCWGANSYGESIDQGHGSGAVYAPEENDNGPIGGWLAVAAGGRATCAIHDDGGAVHTIYCAGNDASGQRGDGAADNTGPTLQPISDTDDGPVTDWSAVSAGVDHFCALRPTGEAYCWGKNSLGEVGDGSTSPAPSPHRVVATVEDGAVPFATIAPGDVMTCAVGGPGAFAGRLYCWGSNGYGQLGATGLGTEPSPRRIGAASDWISVSASYLVACGARAGGVACWGDGSRGLVGDGAWAFQGTPQAVSGLGAGVTRVSVGYLAACAALPTGGARCWGENIDGELGNGETSTKQVPTQVLPADGAWTAVAAASTHTCGIHDGTVMCWGWNDDTQAFGPPLGEGARAPTTVAGVPTPAIEISVGVFGACATVDIGGGVLHPYCWGYDARGELGTNSIGNVTAPVEIASTGSWSSLVQTGQTSCALVAGARMCWGSGEDYAQGNNATADVAVPTAADAKVWSDVSLGFDFGCGIESSSGALWCWGTDDHQVQGDGPTTTDAPTPHLVMSGTAFSSVAAAWNGDHACAIASGTDDLYCWGANLYGQVGKPANAARDTPQLVDNGTWKAVAAGALFTCAIKDEGANLGELWCWGDENETQLGIDELEAYQEAPQQNGATLGWTAVSLGAEHACGVRDGNLYCWGRNTHGQLGVGTGAAGTPVDVELP